MEINLWRRNALLVIIISLMLSLPMVSSCGDGDKSEVGTIKVGCTEPLTGNAAQWGIAQARGEELAIEDINDAGGITLNGKKYLFEAIDYDDKYTAEGALAGAKKLIEDDEVTFMIVFGTASGLASQPYIEEHKVVAFYGGYSAEFLGPDHPYSFRHTSTTTEFAPALFNYITTNLPDLETIALLAPNDDTGISVMEITKGVAEEAGLTVVAEELYVRGATDYYPILTKVLAEDPDIIDCDCAPPADYGLIIKQGRELGFEGQFTNSCNYDLTVVDIAGEAAEGALSQTVAYPTDALATQGQKDLYTKFTAKWDASEWNPSVATWYDAIMIFKQAVEGSQSLDPDVLVEYMETHTFETTWGEIGFGGESQYGAPRQILIPPAVAIIRNGQIEVAALQPLPDWY